MALDDAVVARDAALLQTYRDTRELLATGATTHEVLWSLWSGTSWPTRLERAAATGGPAGRAADRDLDVVVALFELAARSSDRLERRGLSAFLDELQAQQIPADTLADQGTQGEGVRVLTAHRSKGLEWQVVESLYPDTPGGSGPSQLQHLMSFSVGLAFFLPPLRSE